MTSRPATILLTALAALALAEQSLLAQVETDPDSVPAARRGLPPPPPVSPGGAFLRSLALPAWGHASIDSGRGVFYTFVEAGSIWMLFRVGSRLDSARDELRVREASARSQAEAAGLTDEREILEAIENDPDVQDRRRRVRARKGQREDWIAIAITSVLLSGVDAFVSAHLKDFPDPIDTTFQRSPRGGWEVGSRLRLPLWRE
ncbi:MAG: hypothetical protein RQ745_09355 [Longimicrobiales bacterium]|nr:hypothetical protein [Longimicrobiales bacterium]